MGHLSVPSWRGQGPTAALAAILALTGAIAACGPSIARAAVPEPPGGRIEQTPEALRDVGIDEHLGRSIPLNLPFRDSAGAPVQLHELVAGRRPVILTLNYADCPMLCNLQLDGLADAMRQVSLVPGKDFDLITVSINPAETPERTRAFAAKYHALLGLPEGTGAGSADAAWHFLAGEQDSISRLAQATGFKYGYVKSEQEFAHTAAFMVLSPEGQITRYIYGVLFEPRDLRLALVEAAEGKVGSTLDRILLFCFHYDAATGRYAPMAQNIMRLGGFVTMLVLGAALSIYWRREIRARFQGGSSRPGA